MDFNTVLRKFETPKDINFNSDVLSEVSKAALKVEPALTRKSIFKIIVEMKIYDLSILNMADKPNRSYTKYTEEICLINRSC